MAKALLGHVGQDLDVRMVAELRRLRTRVRELEAEVAQLREASNEVSGNLMLDEDILTLSVGQQATPREPALT